MATSRSSRIRLTAALIVAVAGVIATASYAAIVTTLNSNINFGILEFQASHVGNIQLGTNGSVTVTGSGLTYDGGATAGRVRVTPSPATGVLEIKCTNTGKLKGSSGGTSLNMDNIQISIDSGVAYGAGAVCQGIKNANPVAATVNLASSPTPMIYVGGRLVIPSNQLSSAVPSYSSTNGGGQAVTLRVLFQ